MQISVIIPVYNAELYIRKAVESALNQAETGEVILVEDGSPDNSLQVCQTLAQEYPKVKLYQHPENRNHGAARSRNLGIEKSTLEYIAFLDADDFYLPERFAVAKRIFDNNPTIDGVYEAAGVYLENNLARKQWYEHGLDENHLATIRSRILPKDLFSSIILVKDGDFSIVALTIRRRILEQAGLFDVKLRIGQDTVFRWKLAAVGNLAPGQLDKPVVKYRIHGENRVSGAKRDIKEVQANHMQTWLVMWRWGKDKLTDKQKCDLITSFSMLINRPVRVQGFFDRLGRSLNTRRYLMKLLFTFPRLSFYWSYWKQYLPNLAFISYRIGKLLDYLKNL